MTEQTSVHAKRLVTEQLSQLLTIVVIVLDRVLLTSVFYRMWGEQGFTTWSVIVSLAGLVGLAEFGFAMYFNNALALAVQGDDKPKAIRMFRTGLTLLSLAGILGWLLVVSFSYMFLVEGQGAAHFVSKEYAIAVIALLTLSPALRMPMVVIYALYRAHLRFIHYNLIYSSADLARIVLSAFVVMFLHGNLLAAALVAASATVVLQVTYFVWHARQEFTDFNLAPALPTPKEVGEIARLSTAYFSQTFSTILLTSLPVLLLERRAVSAGFLAAFVLVRTLMGLPRIVLQSVGVVIGYESARHLARGDAVQAMVVVRQSSNSIAVASGLLTGALLVLGEQITHLWVGKANVFIPSYALASGIPLVLTAASVVSHNILISSNTPYLAAIGRFLQLVLTIIFFIAAPIGDKGLSMLLALGIGEVFGYAFLSYVAVHRRIPEAGVGFHANVIVRSVVACAASWGAIGAFAGLISVGPDYAWTINGAFAAIFCGTVFILFGLDGAQRNALSGFLTTRKQGV